MDGFFEIEKLIGNENPKGYYKRINEPKNNLQLLKEHLNQISCDIYSRIEFTWRFGLPFSEETITEQYILYQYYALAISRNYPITLLAAKKEYLTGNDIEIALETDKGFVLFPKTTTAHNRPHLSPPFFVSAFLLS